MTDHFNFELFLIRSRKFSLMIVSFDRSVEAGSSKYLTESGPNAFDHYYKLRQNEAVYIANETRKLRMFPKEILISHVVNVLIGVPSEVFIFSKVSTSSFYNVTIYFHYYCSNMFYLLHIVIKCFPFISINALDFCFIV